LAERSGNRVRQIRYQISDIRKTAETLLLSVFCCLLCLKLAQAANYYVDQGNPSASDSNPGTQSSPWLTLQQAANTVLAGDTVTVNSGTYNERVTFPSGHSGSAGNMIVFKANPALSVTMQGFDTDGCPYLHIEGFSITNTPAGWLGGGIWVASDNVEIVGNYFYNLTGAGIQASWQTPWTQNVLVSGNTIYHSQYGIIAEGTNWTVENNEVNRIYQYDTTGDCDYSRFFGANIIFKSNYFHGSYQSEIGTCHTDCFQTFDNNGEYAQHILFDGNWCSEADEGLMGESYYYNNSYDITFRNNVFAHTWAWGLAIEELKEVTVVNNTFAYINYHAAGFGNGATGTVQNNIFYNAGSNYWADNTSTITLSGNNLIDPPGYPYYSVSSDLLNEDPQFSDVNTTDPTLLPSYSGPANLTFDVFHLQPTSPAIDAGVTPANFNYDKDAVIRPVGNAWDIGAYEFCPSGNCPKTNNPPQLPPPLPPPSQPPPGGTGTTVSDLSAVQVYPNPWRSDKHAGKSVTFASLPSGSTVKIFTVSGHLIKTLGPQTSALGTASWDLTNDAGEKVASGIYLYLITDSQGDKGRGKMAVIR